MAQAGVIYVAYGQKARTEAFLSVQSLRATNRALPVCVIGEPVPGVECIEFPRRDAGGRWAKLNLDLLSPFEQTLYLDADTRISGCLSAGFRALDDGWELVVCPSTKQGPSVMSHAGADDRNATFDALGCRDVLGLQAGVFYFRRAGAVSRLFAAWREEWGRFGDQDQPALLRALHRVPVRVWLFSSEYNGGNVVQHLFGRAR